MDGKQLRMKTRALNPYRKKIDDYALLDLNKTISLGDKKIQLKRHNFSLYR